MKRFFIISIFCCAFISLLNAQDFTITAKVDSSFLFIGEQTGLSFDVEQLQNEKIQLPLFSDTIIAGIEIVKREKPDTTILNNGRMKVQHKFVITSFDTALYYIPPFVIYNEKGDTIESNPLSLKVFTVDIDSEQYQLADIKPIYEPPFDWMGLLFILLYILLASLIIALIYWLVRRYLLKKPMFTTKLEIERPAHEIALELLDIIRNEKRWEQGKAKAYYTDITDILRTYIMKRYGINALESTSDEILSMLRNLNLDRELILSLKILLDLSDLVKFAKWEPMIDDYLKSLTIAYTFVNETKEVSPETSDIKDETSETKN